MMTVTHNVQCAGCTHLRLAALAKRISMAVVEQEASSLTLSAHARSEGYCSCPVCVCVYVCVCS